MSGFFLQKKTGQQVCQEMVQGEISPVCGWPSLTLQVLLVEKTDAIEHREMSQQVILYALRKVSNMLKSIRLKNFKIIEASSLLPLQPCTVLIGRNGSGKSSLVDALDWPGQAVSSGALAATEPFQRVRDIIRNWEPDRSPHFQREVTFHTDDVSVHDAFYRVEVGASDPAGEVPEIVAEELSTLPNARNRIHTDAETGKRLDTSGKFLRTNDSADRLALTDLVDANTHRGGELLRSFLERAVFLRLHPRSIASVAPARRKRAQPRLLDEEGSGLAELLSQLDDQTMHVLVEKLSLIFQGVSGVQVHEPQSPAERRFFACIESQSGEEALRSIPAWVLSQGIRRVTALLAVLLHTNPLL